MFPHTRTRGETFRIGFPSCQSQPQHLYPPCVHNISLSISPMAFKFGYMVPLDRILNVSTSDNLTFCTLCPYWQNIFMDDFQIWTYTDHVSMDRISDLSNFGDHGPIFKVHVTAGFKAHLMCENIAFYILCPKVFFYGTMAFKFAHVTMGRISAVSTCGAPWPNFQGHSRTLMYENIAFFTFSPQYFPKYYSTGILIWIYDDYG